MSTQNNSVKITLIVVIGIIVLALLGINFFSTVSGNDTIRVMGQSSLDITPDMVSVYFTVETKDKSSQIARDKNAEIVAQLKKSLLDLGFSDKDIQTTNFNLYEDKDYETGVSRGFMVTHSVIVKFSTEDITKIGGVVDAGINSGAHVNYIGFELSPQAHNDAKAEAIGLAAQDARLKAEALASGLDKNVGKLVSVSDSSFDYNPWIAYRAEGASDSVVLKAASDIAPSEQTISAQVTAVYRIA